MTWTVGRGGGRGGSARGAGIGPAVGVTLALGVALGVAYLGTVEVERGEGGGPRVVSAVQPELLPAPEWGIPRLNSAKTPATLRMEALTRLLRVLGAMTAMALSVALLTLVILGVGRSARKRHALAVRTSLGAGPLRLLVGLGQEAVSPAAAGLLLGLASSVPVTLIQAGSWPGPIPPGALPSPLALTGAVALALVAAAILTLIPFLGRPREARLRSALEAGPRLTAGRRERTLRGGLVVVQVGASLALVVAAGLLTRERDAPRAGPEPAPVLTMELEPLEGIEASPGERLRFYEGLLERAAGFTTVEAESIASTGAWVGLGLEEVVLAECGACSNGGLPQPLTAPVLRQHVVSPGHFESLGIELLDGRTFTHDDRPDTPLVALTSGSLARVGFEDGDPLGHQVQVGGMEGVLVTVVGVVDDLPDAGTTARGDPVPTLYLPLLQHPPDRGGLALRLAEEDGEGPTPTVEAPGAELVPAVEAAVAEIGEGRWRATRPRSLARVRTDHRAPTRWLGVVFTLMGVSVLVLALHGLAAVTRYNVEGRRREVGIRMALGAAPSRVARRILSESARTLGVGGALGLWTALLVGGLMQPLGVPLFEPLPTLGVLALLVGAGLLATLGPARAAAATDPAAAIREE